MKRQWIIKRQSQETADGQKQWEQTYQLLLRAEAEQRPGDEGSVSPVVQAIAPKGF